MARPKKEKPSDPVSDAGSNSMSIVGDALRSYIERIENLEHDKAVVAEDIKEVFIEVKSAGFDTKIVRKILKIRAQDEADRRKQEMLLESYMAALDMI